MKMKAVVGAACIGAALFATGCTPQERASQESMEAPERPYVLAASAIEAGRHIAVIGGCNDCHTAGYAASGGRLPETDWLKGSPVGQYGPWGTTYAPNLRLTAAGMTEDEWVTFLQTHEGGRPPMPWDIMRAYDPRDLRALHQFIRQLPGEMGVAMPAGLPPGEPPPPPYADYLTHGGPPPG